MTSIIEGYPEEKLPSSSQLPKTFADITYFYASLRYPLFDSLDDLLVIVRVGRVWRDGHNDVPAVDQQDLTPEIRFPQTILRCCKFHIDMTYSVGIPINVVLDCYLSIRAS